MNSNPVVKFVMYWHSDLVDPLPFKLALSTTDTPPKDSENNVVSSMTPSGRHEHDNASRENGRVRIRPLCHQNEPLPLRGTPFTRPPPVITIITARRSEFHGSISGYGRQNRKRKCACRREFHLVRERLTLFIGGQTENGAYHAETKIVFPTLNKINNCRGADKSRAVY